MRRSSGPPPCRFFLKGQCTAGSKCRFRHDASAAAISQSEKAKAQFQKVDAPPASIPTLCRYINSATGCRLGDTCPFYHSAYEADERDRQRRHAKPRAKVPPAKAAAAPAAAASATLKMAARGGGGGEASEAAAADGSGQSAEEESAPFADFADEESAEVEWELGESAYYYGGTEAEAAKEAAPGIGWAAVAAKGVPEEVLAAAAEAPPSKRGGGAAGGGPLCKFFLQGRCKNGETCRFSHAVPSAGAAGAGVAEERRSPQDAADAAEGRSAEESSALDALEARASAEASCGICLEPIQGSPGSDEYRPRNRFGLLTGCAHPFCLSCIREWRGAGAETARTCPLCRQETWFVVPSAKLVTDAPRKEALIEAYKASLRRIPCRHFDEGRGECPFGTSCFYRHAYADGTEASRQLRLVQGMTAVEEGASGGGRGAGGGVGGGVITQVHQGTTSLADWLPGR